MRLSFLLAVLAFALSAGEGRAAPGTLNAQSFELQWVLEPNVVSTGDAWVGRHRVVVATRLLPTGLFVANAPVTAADGTILMGVGQQLVKLHARQLTACNLSRGMTGRVVNKRVCLIDTDNDGTFDSYFERGSNPSNFFLEWTGHIPETLDRIAAPSFRTAPAAEMTDAPAIRLLFARILDGGLRLPITLRHDGRNLAIFFFEFGGRTTRIVPIDDDCHEGDVQGLCASSIFPSQLRFAGLVVDLLERRNEDVRMRVRAPFDRVTVRIADTSQSGFPMGRISVVENQ